MSSIDAAPEKKISIVHPLALNSSSGCDSSLFCLPLFRFGWNNTQICPDKLNYIKLKTRCEMHTRTGHWCALNIHRMGNRKRFIFLLRHIAAVLYNVLYGRVACIVCVCVCAVCTLCASEDWLDRPKKHVEQCVKNTRVLPVFFEMIVIYEFLWSFMRRPKIIVENSNINHTVASRLFTS